MQVRAYYDALRMGQPSQDKPRKEGLTLAQVFAMAEAVANGTKRLPEPKTRLESIGICPDCGEALLECKCKKKGNKR